ncbi:TPA: hypothetical protein KTX52_002981 [Enterococcus faecium]|nr:hypothetical protein [Enterococcus faecium]
MPQLPCPSPARVGIADARHRSRHEQGHVGLHDRWRGAQATRAARGAHEPRLPTRALRS